MKNNPKNAKAALRRGLKIKIKLKCEKVRTKRFNSGSKAMKIQFTTSVSQC